MKAARHFFLSIAAQLPQVAHEESLRNDDAGEIDEIEIGGDELRVVGLRGGVNDCVSHGQLVFDAHP